MQTTNLFPQIPQISPAVLSLIFNKTTFSLVFVVFLVFYFIVAGALWYHWTRYGMGRAEITIVKTLFLFVSIVLFLFSFTGIIYL